MHEDAGGPGQSAAHVLAVLPAHTVGDGPVVALHLGTPVTSHVLYGTDELSSSAHKLPFGVRISPQLIKASPRLNNPLIQKSFMALLLP